MILEYVNVALSVISAVGLGYLLVSGEYAIGYRRFFNWVLVGLLLYAFTGIIALFYAPPALHLVHAVSALFVAGGGYTVIAPRLDMSEDFHGIDF